MIEITGNKEHEYFGEVRWCDEDVRNALDCCNAEITDSAVEAVREFCQSSHFTERMIERGWDEMYSFIESHRQEWEGDGHEA